MNNWERFEINCTKYLIDKFGKYAEFIHQGSSDSTVSDILVKTATNQNFYIDAKKSPAQCGQFVLLPNIEKRVFEYSEKNANRINSYAIEIINFMNEDFDGFREAGTAGKDITMKNGAFIFSQWVIQTYQEKKTKFFITNNHTILPIEFFSDYFEISAKYRIKRSGSGNVGKNKIPQILQFLTYNSEYNNLITNTKIAEDKLFVFSNANLQNEKFIYGQYEYMFSKRNNSYELRRLSNTYNANVIFSIKLKRNKNGITDNEFIEFLK